MNTPLRSSSIDTLKCLCVILVVFLHCTSAEFNPLIPVTRCAVPCFFFISGFLTYNRSSGIMQEQFDRSIRKIGKILLYSILLYTFFEEGMYLLNTGQWLSISVKDLLKFILFNKTPFGYHLWYLAAYVYVLLIMRYFPGLTRFLTFCIPVLLLIHLACGKYGLILFDREFATFYFRNFLFYGLPCFLIGQLLAHNKELLGKFKQSYIAGLLLLWVIVAEFEYFLLDFYHYNASGDLYVSTIPLGISLFLLFLNRNKVHQSGFLQKAGKEDSLLIYILHPIVATLLLSFCGKSGFENFWLGYPFAFSVLILSFVLSRIIYKTGFGKF